MKRNDPYHWTITLRGKTRAKAVPFVGTLDAALDAADQEESAVAFTVIEFKVTRGKRANVAGLPRAGNAATPTQSTKSNQ